MATQGLEIKVGADVQGAVSAIDILSHQFDRLQKIASLPGLSFSQYERVNKLLLQSQRDLANFSRAQEVAARSSKGFIQGTNQSTTALTNFSRVVQDAPFGIIGVANNIDPLINSFISLRKETGSAKAAFAALGSSLIGGGGLALAVSLVTSGLVLFAQSKQKAASESKKLKEEEDVFVNTLAKEKTQLASLYSVATNANVPILARNEAIKELRANYGAYLKDFSDEEILAGKAAVAYSKLSVALINVARARAAEKKQEELQRKILDNEEKIVSIRERAQKEAAAAKTFTQQISGGTIGSSVSVLVTAADQQKSIFKDARTETNLLRKENEGYSNEITNLAAVIIKNQVNPLKDVVTSNNSATESTNKNTKAVRENLNTRAELNGALERSLELIIKQKEEQAKMDADVLKNLPKRKPGDQLNNVLISTGDGTGLDALQGVTEKLINIKDIINNGINGGIDTFFNAIANNQNPFDAMAQSAARLAAELGAAVVKALVLKAITTAISGGANVGAGRLFGAIGGGLGSSTVRADQLQLLTFFRG